MRKFKNVSCETFAYLSKPPVFNMSLNSTTNCKNSFSKSIILIMSFNIFIFYYFPPYGMSGSVRACKIARYLKEKMDFNIISSKTRHWVYDETLLEEVKDIPVLRIPDPLGLFWGGEIKRDKEKLKFFVDSKFLWRYFAEIYIKRKLKKIDLIYVSAPPPSSIILGYNLKNHFNSKLVIELRDEWLSKNKKKEKDLLEILKKADGIVYSYEGLKEKFKIKGVVAEHGYDGKVKGEWTNWEMEKFRIFYAGTLKNAEDSFVRFIKKIKNLKGIEVHYAGIMPRNLPDDVKSFVEYHGFVPYKKLKELLRSADLFLLVFDKIGKHTAPSRFFEYGGYDIPVLCIAPDGIYIEKLVNKRNKGFYLPNDEIEKCKRIIESLKKKKIKVPFTGITWKECAEIIYEYIKKI